MRTLHCRAALCVASALMLALTGCAGRAIAQPGMETFRAVGVATVEEAVGQAAGGVLDWDTTLTATGTGMAPPGAPTPQAGEMAALAAARQMALAELAGKVGGTHVERQARVRDMVFAGEEVRTVVEADLAGIRVVDTDYDAEAGVATVRLQVGLDSAGNPVPERLASRVPLSLHARRLRAEQAARIDAVARLGEQIGRVHVGQEVEVENLMLTKHCAWLKVQSVVAGVEFAEAEWVSEKECRVEACLVLSAEDLAELREEAAAAD